MRRFKWIQLFYDVLQCKRIPDHFRSGIIFGYVIDNHYCCNASFIYSSNDEISFCLNSSVTDTYISMVV